MSSDALLDRLCGLTGMGRRRIRIWVLLLLCVVTFLSLHALTPGFDLMRGSAGGAGLWVVLAVFSAALVCEYVDSSLGMGYGTTLTPLLLLAGFEPLQIVPCVLLSECVTGLSAALLHQRDGNVDLLRDPQARSAAMMLSLLSVVGAVLAVTLALQIPRVWLKTSIGIIILMAGVTTLVTVRRQLRYRRTHLIALGALAAFNKGLSGGGYGPLVTSGQVVSGLSPKKAVAITSLAESLTCFVGLIAYLLLNVRVDWALALPLTLGAMLSVPVATYTVRRLPEKALRASVGVATCLLGIFTLTKLLW